MILLLVYWERPQDALPLLQEVSQLSIQSTRILCWLAAIEAEVHAHLGDVLACEIALNKAKNIGKNEPLGEDRYATGLNASRLAGYEGACFLCLHQPDQALPALQQAFSLLDSQSIRRQSTLLADISSAYAQRGNYLMACQSACQALSLTKQTRSKAVLERVRKVYTKLETWKDSAEVKNLEQQLTTLSTHITI